MLVPNPDLVLMVLRTLISLFLMVLVGSLVMVCRYFGSVIG